MNEVNTQSLITRFPELYDADFYFECDDGWYKLIDELSASLVRGLPASSIFRYQPIVFQVKQKFGGLRFYLNRYLSDELEKLICAAEAGSYRICEVCGEAGDRGGTYWVQTLCPEHWALAKAQQVR